MTRIANLIRNCLSVRLFNMHPIHSRQPKKRGRSNRQFNLGCRPQRNVPGRGFSCEVNSWCPIEIDALPLGRRRALMAKAEDYTVFVKNSIAFPYFGEQYMRNNLISNGRRPCLYT